MMYNYLILFISYDKSISCFRKEFAAHGLSDFVSVECRDVCKDGFGLASTVDAGMIDRISSTDCIQL